MASSSTANMDAQKHSPLDSTFPVMVPHTPELFFDRPTFDQWVQSLNIRPTRTDANPDIDVVVEIMADTSIDKQTFTAKGALTNASGGHPLLDLFNDLGDGMSPDTLNKQLTAAWRSSPIDTLKIIWNARSIHTGKGEKHLWYRCLGWLRENHPLTLLANLDWAVRPVIQKKMKKEEQEGMEDVDIIEKKEADDKNDITRFDVRNGVSHGYYRDLGNLLGLAVKGKLNSEVDPKAVLQTPKQSSARWIKRLEKIRKYEELNLITDEEEKQRAAENVAENCEMPEMTREAAKELRHATKKKNHENFIIMFNHEDPFYRVLHLRIARIFAEQIQHDTELLESGKKKHINRISLAAKWAPSLEGATDRTTFLASTIAELLFPADITNGPTEPRETYLKQARQRYRIRISALRKALDVVERKITSNSYSEITYDKVPSIAMSRYAKLFSKKDLERFSSYLIDVASGNATISGAILLPGHLVRAVLAPSARIGKTIIKKTVIEKMVIDQQWKTMVNRIRESGTLDNALAVVDVSGSMGSTLGDKTTVMDHAVGLGLLIAQVAQPPFANHFITFSENPRLETIDPELELHEQVEDMKSVDWGMTTNFNSVFKDLLLPFAVTHKVPKENMVKRIFVLSDMQFDSATVGAEYTQTNYEQIRQLYEKAGYDMPEMVFWNLAGGLFGQSVPKPVTKYDIGTAMVSGYSQAMLKTFLDNGGFDMEEEEEEEEDDVVEIVMGEDGKEPKEVEPKEVEQKEVDPKEVAPKKKKKPIDPLRVVRVAIGHESYSMLRVVD